jgi:hypothetical protein
VGSEISLGFSGGFSGNLKGVRISCDFKEDDYAVRLSGYGASVSITQKEVGASYSGEIFGIGFEVGASYSAGSFEFEEALVSREFSLPYGSFTITGGLKDKTAYMSFGAVIEF